MELFVTNLVHNDTKAKHRLLHIQGILVRFPTGEIDMYPLKSIHTGCGPTRPLIQWVPWAPSRDIKFLRREFDHSLLSIAEVKNEWNWDTLTSRFVYKELTIVSSQYLFVYCAANRPTNEVSREFRAGVLPRLLLQNSYATTRLCRP
jgi:hypothetical protein